VVVVSFGYTDTPAADLGAEALIDHFDELPATARRLLGMGMVDAVSSSAEPHTGS
jgi:phosphoglycolate phosphatase